MSSPEHQHPPIDPEVSAAVEAERTVGEQVMHVTVLPPEDPAAVRERDGVPPETVGSRPMTPVTSMGSTPVFGLDRTFNGRKAPRYTSYQHYE